MSKPTKRRLLPKDFERPFHPDPEQAKRRRAEALSSAFMRVPHLKVDAARDLLDLGFTQLYQLSGRSPEALYAELCAKRPDVSLERLAEFRLAVYIAETPDPERSKLHPSAWV